MWVAHLQATLFEGSKILWLSGATMSLPTVLIMAFFIVGLCSAQTNEILYPEEGQIQPNATPKPHEISTSVIEQPEYKTGLYSSLTQELQIHSHSRVTVDLKDGYDFMKIMLELLQWNEQDVMQMWIRPADHVDQSHYATDVPDGLSVALQDVLRKVRFATLDEITDHYTHTKAPSEIASMQMQVSETLRDLVSSGQVIHDEDIYYPSFQIPGRYKMDLSGDVNILRHPVVHALQQHPGIANAELDEHFIRDKHPAWYETWAFPQ